MTPSKTTSADNKEEACEEPSNTDASVCEQEQALSENDVTKEAVTFKWYEEREDWDRLAPAVDDDDIKGMTRRHIELYSTFLRHDNLKKTTKRKNENKIRPSDQRKEIQDDARRVELLLNEYLASLLI